MDRHFRMTSTAAGFHVLILALALLARTFVPAGYMISPAASGAPLLTLCSGSGPVTMAMAGHDKTGHASERSHHDGSGDTPCPFVSLLAAATSSPPPLKFIPPPAVTSASFFPADIVTTGHGLAAPPPPSTGPPLPS